MIQNRNIPSLTLQNTTSLTPQMRCVSFHLTAYYKALVVLPAVSCLVILSNILILAFCVGRGEEEVLHAVFSLNYRESGRWVRFLLLATHVLSARRGKGPSAPYQRRKTY